VILMSRLEYYSSMFLDCHLAVSVSASCEESIRKLSELEM
jgi:hypothetical protein